MEDRPLLIIGASTRAAASSAILAGWRPWCVDLFADRDLKKIAQVTPCPKDRYPDGIPDLLDDAPPEVSDDAPVLFTGAMENHPQVIEAIAQKHPLLAGNEPSAIAAARVPAFWDRLVSLPDVRIPSRRPSPDAEPSNFLQKPLRSAGGRHISVWNGQWPDAEHYLQQKITGTALAAIYHRPAQRATVGRIEVAPQLLGVTEQLIGDADFGGHDFLYTGSLGPIPLSTPQRETLQRLGNAVALQTGLRGIFGIDLIRDEAGTFWPVEVNPRYTASIEILELAGARSLTPAPKPVDDTLRHWHAKAIVFAKKQCKPGLIEAFFPENCVADLPEPDAIISPGQPICTLFASSESRDEAVKLLRERAKTLYTRLHS
jgi:uncharacterized protein